MNKSIFVLMIIGVIATTMITSTVATDVFARDGNSGDSGNGGEGGDGDSKAKDRTNNNLITHIAKGGEHGNKALEIKESRNGCSGPSCGGDGGPSLPP